MVSFCFLALLSSGILYYSSGMSNITESIKPDAKKNELEKESILRELNDLKNNYDDIILENKTMSLELIQERDKVVKLISDLVIFNGNQYDLMKYKKEVKSLKVKLKILTIENAVLERKNVLISVQRDSTKVVLQDSEKHNDDLKRDLENTVEKFSKLVVSGTTIVTYKLRNSGEVTITDKASKVEGINISFVIDKNEIAKPIAKIYYIQVMNSENTVIGDNNMETHQYKSLQYSLASNVSYEKKMMRVTENLTGKNFAKGTYFVNIFDGEELVDESSFTLK